MNITKTPSAKFPALLENEEGVVILATGYASGNHGYVGTIISSQFKDEIGKYSTSWSSQFKPYQGSVTLSK